MRLRCCLCKTVRFDTGFTCSTGSEDGLIHNAGKLRDQGSIALALWQSGWEGRGFVVVRFVVVRFVAVEGGG